MHFAFIVDPPDSLKPAKDSSIAMMRAAQAAGHGVSIIEAPDLFWDSQADAVAAEALSITLTASAESWYVPGERRTLALRDVDAIVMRKDPPFDLEYVTATWLLERAEHDGARVFNRPRALRDHSEKLSIAEFARFAAPTRVARRAEAIDAFIDEHADVILKPLDGMGGAGVFRVRRDDPNRNAIIEALTDLGRRTIMAQRYLPAISDGDKRILIIDGEVVPYCLARIPRSGETRGNLAAGGRGVARPLSPRDREIATALAPVLAARGLFLVGIDVIGDCLTEINVTSPTCMVEIQAQTGFDVAAMFITALERAVRAAPLTSRGAGVVDA
ncbi:glutathione synthase [Rhodocyclus tenuis]|uniref:Glutathione synthetase n=1 Tax=Rhodocyclus gracilis TaxID=2929842 RepID=A0ABX0WIG3_9RHOO|nr:glutathione synthase [Rhodocyclus gracilis]MRD73450.1 glutathione synthase [Rhodocyclus gracilis]NJA88440.1 glutathione synthase [Rhodocyclus gracilis]